MQKAWAINIRNGMDNILPPLWKFTSALRLDKIKRARRRVDIYVLYADAEDNFRRKMFLNEEDEKKLLAGSDLKHINNTLSEIGSYKSEERELLLRLKDFITKEADLSIVVSEHPKVFRSERAYNFFIEVLQEFDVMDGNGRLARGKQKYINAVRKSELYKKHILEDDFLLKNYIIEVNKILNSNLSETNLSPYSLIETQKIELFIKEKFL
ncbi:MAG: hypothetical protein ACPG6B_02620 [Oceanihabitans sp.]